MEIATIKLTEFLRKKKKESEALVNSVDWKERKQEWITSVNSLFKQIEKWLKPSIDEEIVLIAKKEIQLDEEYLGKYSISSMRLKIGNDVIELKPVGTLILGSKGRVDINLREKKVPLVHKDDEWKIFVREPIVKYYPLDEESFAEVMMQLMQ